MKKEYNIVGLDCGHCALTLEKYLEKIDGVIFCSVNFATSKLVLDIEDEKYKETIKNVYKTTKQVNPSVRISENDDNANKTSVVDIVLYIIGILIGVVVVFLKMNPVLFYTMLSLSILCLGYNTFYKAIMQLGSFNVNENTLITISILGAVAIGENTEGLMVIALYTLGKMLESRAVNYSRKSIATLINNQPEFAMKLVDNIEKKVDPNEVVIGDKIIVRAGEKIALDGIVVDGECSVDKSHLTGESVPVLISNGDYVASGCIVLDGVVTIKVTSEFKDGTVSKILSLVSDANSKKSKTENFISKFSSWYTIGVIISALIVFAIVSIVTKDLITAVYRGLVFLVVSCPCAFAISIPLTYFSGIGKSSKNGILIKGSNFIDLCANVDKVIFDKTGTLTTGKFEVVNIEVTGNLSEKEFMSIVVAGEKNSLHPIARAICEHCDDENNLKVKKFTEIAGQGIEYSIGKNKYFVGRKRTASGQTIAVVTENDIEIGKIYLHDKVKEESKTVISQIKEMGIKTMMLSGDNREVAQNVSEALGVDEFKAELLPEDKFKIVEEIKSKGEKIAFVGDGLNDAPALTLSDIGISMGIMGSDATIEASDIVIADDNLKQIPKLIKISKKTRRIAIGNIIFAGITKFAFLMLGAFGVTGMAFAVFADVGVTLLAILNSLRVLVSKI